MSLARAIASGDLAELPSRREEDWRWSDIRGLIRIIPQPSRPVSSHRPGPFDPLADQVIEIINGVGGEPIFLAAGKRKTVGLRFIAAGAGSHNARIQVNLAPGAELTLLESYEGDAADYVSAIDLNIELAPGAGLERIVLAGDGPNAVRVSQCAVLLSPASSLKQTVMTSGAKRQRLETQVRHRGGGAIAGLDGLYLVGDRRHADITTVVTHEEPDGKTHQKIRGVAKDQGRGVFQGRIIVARGADRTLADMRHDALVLSDRAEVDAKPELEIYADDVECAHGNSIGALDPEALFYARQRGLSEEAARALLIRAFVGRIVDLIGTQAVRDVAAAWIENEIGWAP